MHKTYFKEDMRKRRKRKAPVLDITESQLQEQLNDLLNAYQIRYIRIPDSIWHWLKRNAPVEVIRAMSDALGGMPDNVCMIPISDRYSLMLAIELKVKGRKKRGKQKHWQSTISRTPDENIALIEEYVKQADIVKEILERVKEYES